MGRAGSRWDAVAFGAACSRWVAARRYVGTAEEAARYAGEATRTQDQLDSV
jgi:hypothetical protein